MKLSNDQKAVAMQLYAEGIALGYTARQICEYINTELGVELDESTYRKAYAVFKEMEMAESEETIEKRQAQLLLMTKRDLRQREERKRLILERALVEQQVKDYVNKSAVAIAMEKIWKRTFNVEPRLTLVENYGDQSGLVPIYGYGDIHWGYTIENDKLVYNKEIAAGRVDAIFRYIADDIKRKHHKRVYIADLADDIEGAALRTSQLLRIVESMTEQAKGYAEHLIKNIKKLALDFPDVDFTFLHVSEDNHSQLRLHNTSRDELPENLQLLVTSQIATFVDTAHSFDKLLNFKYVPAPEIIVNFGEMRIVVAHGHQYNKNDDILALAAKRHQLQVHFGLIGHWHQFSHKNKEVLHGIQTSLMFAPAVVGDTDYSERLFLSSRPGFIKLMVNLRKKYITSKQILFEDGEET